jgi:hypothetical protein
MQSLGDPVALPSPLFRCEPSPDPAVVALLAGEFSSADEVAMLYNRDIWVWDGDRHYAFGGERDAVERTLVCVEGGE